MANIPLQLDLDSQEIMPVINSIITQVNAHSAGTFGNITLSGLLFESAQDSITAHAGGGQGAATPLTKEVNRITTVATTGDSVMLPTSAAGLTLFLINASTNPMQVFGSGTDTIDGVATATGISQMQGSSVIYTCTTAGSWVTNGIGTGYFGSLPTVSSTNGITATAGGTIGTSLVLGSVINRITTVATAADAVRLPASAPGLQITVTNAAAANSMNVFPNVAGDSINSAAAGTAFALPAGKTAQFTCAVAGAWHAVLSA